MDDEVDRTGDSTIGIGPTQSHRQSIHQRNSSSPTPPASGDEDNKDDGITGGSPPNARTRQPHLAVDRPLPPFTAEVQLAIAQVLRSLDPLDASDFNATAHINQLFPTEQSLAGIDDVIAGMVREIGVCDAHIRSVVRGQAAAHRSSPADDAKLTSDTTITPAIAAAVGDDSSSSGGVALMADGHAALGAAQLCIRSLCAQIGDIKRRAEHTDDAVRQITRDIKQLDCAKRNLTAAITTLNHLHMLVGGVESLVRLVERRQYAELVGPLQAITEVNEHFGPYVGRIEQIGELSERVRAIHRELAAQIGADFRAVFGTGGGGGTASSALSEAKVVQGNVIGTKLTATQLADACKVVNVLDGSVRRDLLKWFIALQLEEYAQLFHENQDIAWLDRIDKRYAWLKRHLLDFEDRHGRIFPTDWEVSERIAVRFCQITRDQLRQLVGRRRAEVDVKLLLFAIAKTAAFEVLLAKRFAGTTLAAPSSPSSSSNDAKTKAAAEAPETSIAPSIEGGGDASSAQPPPSPFADLIGNCFKPFLNIYTDSIDRSLSDILERFVADARIASATTPAASTASPSDAGESPVYPSCADLFVFYKKCMVQCAQLSYGQPLLDLTVIFKRYLREYAQRLLEPRLVASAAGAAVLANGGGATGMSASLLALSSSVGTGGGSSMFGSMANSAAATTTKHNLQQLTSQAGQVLHSLLKEQTGGPSLTSSASSASLSATTLAASNAAASASATISSATAAAAAKLSSAVSGASGGSTSASSSAASAAAATSIDPSMVGRYTRAELQKLCSVLSTAEYCLETVGQLEEKLREKIVPALRDRVDLADERDGFHRIIAQCIQLLVVDVEAGCDVALAAMVRIQWQQVSSVGDQSAYVSQLAATLRHTVPHVRDNLAASRKYYTQFCLKFVSAFMPKFCGALYRCRPATETVALAAAAAAAAADSAAAGGGGGGGAHDGDGHGTARHDHHHATGAIMGCEQLLLDTHSIKTILLDLPSIGSQVKRKAPASFTKVVLRGMAQPEAIVKLVMAPLGGGGATVAAAAAAHVAYAEQYVRMLPHSTPVEFGRVLDMKGVVKRADQAPLLAAYRQVVQRQQQQQQLQDDPYVGAPADDDADDSQPDAADALVAATMPEVAPPPVPHQGHMRKLEAMIKKRLP